MDVTGVTGIEERMGIQLTSTPKLTQELLRCSRRRRGEVVTGSAELTPYNNYEGLFH